MLVQASVIPPEKEQVYIGIVKFCNRIVHIYEDIDLKQVYDILHNHLDDLREFVGFIVRKYFA